MKHSSQEVKSIIFTINNRGQMKIHMKFFHHITNSGSPLTSGPVFGLIIYSDPTYSPTGLEGGIKKLLWKTTYLMSWPICH
jgi:hypothetical protein